ncbi:hypothetical protein SAMN05421858_3199 [Haladaptatus litoreus]|uniref:Alpha-L-rhamnosidase n=1 Tax=Haladaptatus litoreus TaxID=553468 RepID=A0A1N7CRD1_9EURY|nr:hypothetical protein [Haladaptatus litoreus]SIR66159.1 hypothetical protein SAMN05421858_3199 [Haladaptatus litoreus]
MSDIRAAFDSFPKRATKTDDLDDIYACTGNRAYLVGSQNGTFPDIGHHVEDEMGGLWAHPIKLLDGFWLRVSDGENGTWLTDAERFENRGIGTVHRYSLDAPAVRVEQRSVVPDDTTGLLVEYEFENESGRELDLNLRFLARSDLLPAWLSDEVGLSDAPDEGDIRDELFVASDRDNPWAVAVGASTDITDIRTGRDLWGPERTAGDGVSGELATSVSLAPDERASVTVSIAGSNSGVEDALDRLSHLQSNATTLVAEKRERYEKLENQASIRSPDEYLDDIYSWVKLNLDMLRRDVPGVGEGFGAGLPTYPWWFGTDGAYTVQGALPMGYHEQAKETLRTLATLSERENGNGRIIHEASTNGAVFNPGNTQETPHFVRAVYDTYRWTGDEQFLEELYPACRKAMRYLFEERDDDTDGRPEGYGIMEVKGLNLELIDSAVYGLDGLRALKRLATAVGDEETASWSHSFASEVESAVEPFFWAEGEEMYRDMVGTPEEMLNHLDDIRWQMEESGNERGLAWCDRIEARAREAIEAGEPDDEAWQFKQWVVTTPLEVGLAPEARATSALNRLESDEFSGEWGLKLSGTGNENFMTISTGVMAVAEAEYGRVDAAIDYLDRMAKTEPLHMPGSISEMLPDFGCAVQAWTAYGFGRVLVEHIAGIRPSAGSQSLMISPTLPDEWNHLTISDISLGKTTAQYHIEQDDESVVLQFEIEDAGWTLDFNLPAVNGRVDSIRIGKRRYQSFDEVKNIELPSGQTTIRVDF